MVLVVQKGTGEAAMTVRVVVAFTLSGEALDPDIVSAKLRLRPSNAARKGELRRNGTVNQIGLWRYDVEVLDPIRVGDAVRVLLDRLRPVWPIAVEFGQWLESEVDISIEPTDRIPGIGIDQLVIRDLAELNARLDIGITADILQDSDGQVSE
jgi:hypothetical protein